MPLDREAEELLGRQRARNLTRTKPEEISVEVWLSAWTWVFPDRRTVQTRRHVADMLRPFRQAHGRRRMFEVTALDAQAWALEHPDQVRYLSAAWRKAVLMQVVGSNIWQLVELPAREKERRRPPSAEELERILRACDGREEEFRRMVEVAAYSGAREGGLIGLRRQDVDLAGRRMTVTEKGGKTRPLALIGPALTAMAQQLLVPSHIDGRVFHSRTHRAHTPDSVQKAWRRVRGDFPHGFHALKHFAATWLSAQGIDPLDLAVQLGHLDSAGRPYRALIDQTYNHPDHEDALRRLTDRVDATG